MTSLIRGLLLLLPALTWTTLASTGVQGASVLIEVAAGPHDRHAVPVSVTIPAGVAVPDAPVLRSEQDKSTTVAQWEEDGRRLWWIESGLKQGQTRRYRLAAGTGRAGSPHAVTSRDDGRQVVIAVGDRPALHYNHAVFPSPDPDKPYHARSGFIHPLQTPKGLVVTDPMPADHLHQHGIMFAWRNTSFEGRKVNFWEDAAREGRIQHEAIEQLVSGPVFGELLVRLRHLDLTAPAGPKDVLHETWRVRVFGIADPFLWELESTQQLVGGSPLVVHQFHYGGMMIRGSAQWTDPQRSGFLTSEGHDRGSGNHTRPDWVEFYGPVSDELAGMLCMGHPQNFRTPQPVRLHPSMPYFCFAPMVLGEFRLAEDQPYRSSFRFVIHDGRMDREQASPWWNDYASPPRARIVAQR